MRVLGLVGIAALAFVAVADAQTDPPLRAPPGFRVDRLYSVPKASQGSWVALCVDPKGRLIASDQYGKLYRITLPAVTALGPSVVEPIALPIGQAQGLLYAFDSLYVMVATQEFQGSGLYRVRDTDHDDRFDEVTLLRRLEGGGEHGPHSIVLTPDGQGLYVVAGNLTRLPVLDGSHVPRVWGEDHLLPRLWDGNGFMKGYLAPGGWIARTDPEGKRWDLMAVGLRNVFDMAVDRDGELFAFDSDMEWDLNTPWYRPTRLCHITSGAEFGWRSGAGKWPAYYADSLPPVANVGLGSPTGMTFGYGAHFPARYQRALFMADWSYGRLYVATLTPRGASFGATIDEFLSGQPLPLTDLVVNRNDGALYFVVGGRRTQSALYRVTYVGSESTKPDDRPAPMPPERATRLHLESFHGHPDGAALAELWPQLGNADRHVRFAARTALEWQDPLTWRERALAEPNPRLAIPALLALVRVSAADPAHSHPGSPAADSVLASRLFTALGRFSWGQFDGDLRLDWLRAYEVALNRVGRPPRTEQIRLGRLFESHFPAHDRATATELAQLMVYLESPHAAPRLMAALRSAPTQEEQIEYARAVRVLRTGWTLPLREQQFRWYAAAGRMKGGLSLKGFLRDMKADAVATLTPAEHHRLEAILDPPPQPTGSQAPAAAPRTFVKEWALDELAPLVERGLRGGRKYERGRRVAASAGCFNCHRFDAEGAAVGPDLTGSGGRFSARDLLESILSPSKEISDQYGTLVVIKKDGTGVTGRLTNMTEDSLILMENVLAPGDLTTIKRVDVASIEPAKVSMMPEGLLSAFKLDEIQDLAAFLLSQGQRHGPAFRDPGERDGPAPRRQ